MSFLEYVCRQLMGRPVYGTMWNCPFHDDINPSFSVRPPKVGYPIKFKCFGCSEWGDEFDLCKLFFSKDTYPDRVERLRVMREQYEENGFSFLGENSEQEFIERIWLRKMIKNSNEETRSQGVNTLYDLLDSGAICIDDILEVYSDFRVAQEFEIEKELLCH